MSGNGVDINIKADVARITRQLSAIRKGTIQRAASRAINRAMKSVRTEASKQIRQRLNLKKSDTDSSLRMTYANPDSLRSELHGSVYHLSLKVFKPYDGPDGVTVLVNKQKGSIHLPHAWISHKLGDHVYERVGQDRLPIEKLYGPALAQMIVVEAIHAALKAKAGDAWKKNFLHELNYSLRETGIHVS